MRVVLYSNQSGARINQCNYTGVFPRLAPPIKFALSVVIGSLGYMHSFLWFWVSQMERFSFDGKSRFEFPEISGNE